MIGAIDIGGTKIAVGMVSPTGELLSQAECPTDAERGFGDALQRMTTLVRETEAQAGGTMYGLGIGCTGPVYPHSGTIGQVEFLPGWEGANLVAALTETFQLSVALENDADAIALGEARWGAGQGASPFLYVTVSTGIGAGLVVDGKLYRGVAGAHPEMGHHVIDPQGPLCFCGARGCWESLAGGQAMARWFHENAPPDLSLPDTLGAKEICARTDAHALATIAREGRYLGLGLANLVTLFAPQVIALGGGLMRRRDLFWETIQQTIQTTCGYVPHEKTQLVPAALGSDTGLLGAACTWLHHYGDRSKLT